MPGEVSLAHYGVLFLAVVRSRIKDIISREGDDLLDLVGRQRLFQEALLHKRDPSGDDQRPQPAGQNRRPRGAARTRQAEVDARSVVGATGVLEKGGGQRRQLTLQGGRNESGTMALTVTTWSQSPGSLWWKLFSSAAEAASTTPLL